MRALYKNLTLLAVTATFPALAFAGEDAACPASKAACCPSSAVTTSADSATCPASKSDKLVRVQYKVNGMSGAGCETRLTTVLGKIDGVSEPSACAESRQAKLAIDPAKVKDEQLIAAINKAGFQVESETVAVKLDGLKCEACSSKVSKALAAVKGVSNQQVCHESKNAVVTFDPKKVSQKEIFAAIDTTGFKVVR